MTIPTETLEKWAGLGPWVAVGTDPAEGVDCFWIKSQPNPFMRGFTNEIGAVNGGQNDPKRADNAALIAAAPALAQEVLDLRAILLQEQTNYGIKANALAQHLRAAEAMDGEIVKLKSEVSQLMCLAAETETFARQYQADKATEITAKDAEIARLRGYAKNELRRQIEDISEDRYAAGWMNGIEHVLWGEVQNGENPALLQLAEDAGGWWTFDRFIPLVEWKASKALGEATP